LVDLIMERICKSLRGFHHILKRNTVTVQMIETKVVVLS